MISLRRRLTLGLLVLFLAILGVGLTGVWYVLRRQALGSFDDALRSRAQSLASMVDEDRGSVRFDLSNDFMNRDAKGRAKFRFYDERGAVLAESDPPPPVLADMRAGTVLSPAIRDVPLAEGRPGRAAVCVFSPIPEGGDSGRERPSRNLTLVLVESRQELDGTLDRLLVLVLASAALMTGAVLVSAPRLLARGLAPLEDLARRAGEIDAGALSARFPEVGLPDEIRSISVKLNELLSRLEISFGRERRFSGDISHELRTPVAELKSLVECARRWPDRRTEQDCDDMLGVILGMENLIASMLAIAACENGATAVRTGPVDIAAAASAAVRAGAALASERGLQFRADLAPGCVAADPTLLKSILTNLVDNAVSYAPENTVVRVEGVVSGGEYALVFANAAPGLEVGDVPKLFDGFWRKDLSRTDRHAGLGLTLCRSFSKAMGMSFEASLSEDLVLSLTLKAPTDPDGVA